MLPDPDGNWSGSPNPDVVRDDDDEDYDVGSLELTASSLDSLEAVLNAIEVVRKACTKTERDTVERRELVNKLIMLRIKQEDLREREEHPLQGLQTHGHNFVSYGTVNIRGVNDVNKIYCQVCCHRVWVYLQSSQHCSDCGYSVHASCMPHIMRECVAQKVRTQPDFITRICPERSLIELNYRCVECDRKFMSNDPNALPRLCDYSGLSYCPSCHWNARAVCPARIIHNWDFTPTVVSQASKQYLYLMHNKPVLNVEKESPRMFAVIPELSRCKELRLNVLAMKRYLSVCRIALEEKLLLQLTSRQHFVENATYYSIADLLDMKSGVLEEFLLKVTKVFSDHIRLCVLCKAKGFICEICSATNDDASSEADSVPEEQVIFPFDDLVSVCQKCQAVFHKHCFKGITECPKCNRIKARGNK